MKDWTLRQRISASFLAVLAIMLALAGSNYYRLLSVKAAADGARQVAVPGWVLAAEVRAKWNEGFLLTEEYFDSPATTRPAQLEAIRALDREVDEVFRRFNDVRLEPATAAAVKTLAAHRADYIVLRDRVLQSDVMNAPNGSSQARQQLYPPFQAVRSEANTIVNESRRLAERALDNIVDDVVAAKQGIITAMILALLAAGICGTFLMLAILRPMKSIVAATAAMQGGDLTQRLKLARRDEFNQVETGFNAMGESLTELVGRAQRSAIQVATSVTQIAATSRQQEATATEVAATTTQIGATSREISATSRDLVRTMSEVSGAAEQTATLAGGGQIGLARMESTMRNVVDAAGSVNTKLVVLNEKASHITHVVTTINKVADQTNLLSLNAAIEAEKAGEYGRGFVVVASEIRRLADQTAVATYDIEQIVGEIQSSVSAGVMGMDKFSEEVRRGMQEMEAVGEQLSQIIEHVQSLAPRVSMVNEGMHAQATGADQITLALTQLSDATQQTVESLRQSGLAIEELTTVANDLRQGVSRFKV